MEKIKVLRIIGECKIGGVETITLNYYKNLNHNKIAMDFLFYGKSHEKFDNELKKNGDKIFNVTDYKSGMMKSVREIREIVKKEEYDIVHAQLNSLNFFPLLGAKLGGAKVRIASNHSTANLRYEFKKTLVKYILRPSCGFFATNYAACSEFAGEWAFGKRKKKNGKIKIIHNAISLEDFSFDKDTRNKKRKELGITDEFVVGHVGRFVKQKNHKFLIDVFYEIKKKNKNSILLLIGDGKLEGEIKEYVKSKKLENSVRFLGIRFDVNELMQAIDVFLFPSIYEGLGNVITESQAVALHSISSTAIPKEVKMTEYAEFLSLKKSPNVWADKALEYNNNYNRRDTHNDLINNGYEIKSASDYLLKYYESLL